MFIFPNNLRSKGVEGGWGGRRRTGVWSPSLGY